MKLKLLFISLFLSVCASASQSPIIWKSSCPSGAYNLAAAACLASGGGSGVDTMGAFGSTPNNNGGSISGTTLTLQPADATHPGGISAATYVAFNAKQAAIAGNSCSANNFSNSINSAGTISCAQPAFTNLSGSVAASQMPALTGDITTSAGAVATTLATVNSNVGSFGDATHVPAIAVNGKGLTTGVTSTSIQIPESQVTSLVSDLAAKEPTVTKGNLTEATSSVLTIAGGTNAVIGSGASIQVKQSSTSQDGYVSSTDYPVFNQDPSYQSTFFDDFYGYGPAGSGQYWQSAVSGSGATVNTAGGAPLIDINHPGIVRMQTGTTNAGVANFFTGTEFVFGGGAVTYETLIYLGALSNGTDRYTLRVGFGDNFSGASVFSNGVWFEYIDNVNSGNWTLNAGNGSTQTTNSSTAPSATTWLKLKIVINAAGTLATFYQNGSSIGTVAARIPVAVGNKVNINYQLGKSVGTTSVVMSIDYSYFRQIFTTPR